MPMTTAPAPIASGTAVLLVNLGTPQAPTPGAVRRYLAQFLSDPYVVQIPRLVWWPLLHGLVLPLRSARVARKYAGIWMEGGSPLAVHTQRLAARLQGLLPQVLVDHAMRYAEPARAAAAVLVPWPAAAAGRRRRSLRRAVPGQRGRDRARAGAGSIRIRDVLPVALRPRALAGPGDRRHRARAGRRGRARAGRGVP